MDIGHRSNPFAGVGSGVLDFAQKSTGKVVDESADSGTLGNPGMGAEFLQLVADIFSNVLNA
jgi:hypothetical protein